MAFLKDHRKPLMTFQAAEVEVAVVVAVVAVVVVETTTAQVYEVFAFNSLEKGLAFLSSFDSCFGALSMFFSLLICCHQGRQKTKDCTKLRCTGSAGQSISSN